MEDLRIAKKIIGLSISHYIREKKIYLSQEHYIKVLHRFQIEKVKAMSTSLATHFKLSVK